MTNTGTYVGDINRAVNALRSLGNAAALRAAMVPYLVCERNTFPSAQLFHGCAEAVENDQFSGDSGAPSVATARYP